MAVVEKAVIFYVYDSGVFQRMQGLFVQGSAGLPVRVVYEGDIRGHFSRMLSAAEWEEQDRHCQSAEEGGGESTPHAGSSHDSESSSSADMSEREDGIEATSAAPCPVPDNAPDAAQAGCEDSAGEWEDMSDVSDNSDIFHVEVDPEKPFTTAEDRLLSRCERLAGLLRDHPLLPLHPADTSTAYTDVNSGAAKKTKPKTLSGT